MLLVVQFPEMPGTARACLEAELSSYFEGMHTDASLGAAAAALVRSMMHPIVEERATAHQALQALQLIITASQVDALWHCPMLHVAVG